MPQLERAEVVEPVAIDLEVEGAAHKLLMDHITNLMPNQQRVVRSAVAEYRQLVEHRDFLKSENRKLLKQLADRVRPRAVPAKPKAKARR